jgi:hypothetical protein
MAAIAHPHVLYINCYRMVIQLAAVFVLVP